MYLKKITCLLLTLALITIAVPAKADGDPPPVVGDGNIHPWDNNDGNRVSGPYLVRSGWMWLGYGSNAGLIILPRKDVSQLMKSFGSKSDKAVRKTTGTQVVVRSR